MVNSTVKLLGISRPQSTEPQVQAPVSAGSCVLCTGPTFTALCWRSFQETLPWQAGGCWLWAGSWVQTGTGGERTVFCLYGPLLVASISLWHAWWLGSKNECSERASRKLHCILWSSFGNHSRFHQTRLVEAFTRSTQVQGENTWTPPS